MNESKPINILSDATYSEILKFIDCFKGLAIECELAMFEKFPLIHKESLKSILSTACTEKLKFRNSGYYSKSRNICERYHKERRKSSSPMILLNISRERSIPPTLASRMVINELYRDRSKDELKEMSRFPHRIPDDVLAGNVRMCMINDNQNGPITDIRSRCLGEEYEIRLKKAATESGLHYFDEADLRRTGFDKTPDLKLVLPCLYKGHVINWIESKALFGDEQTHKRYLCKQLVSYENRFGPGIVIYWFGFVESIQHLKDNGDGLIILNDFPAKEHLELF